MRTTLWTQVCCTSSDIHEAALNATAGSQVLRDEVHLINYLLFLMISVTIFYLNFLSYLTEYHN